MVPRFNGGAFSPVTPNNGNPNTVYNTSVPGEPAQPPVPQFRPMASYGWAFQTPQVIDSNADTRSPRAITLQRETAPPPTVRPTSLGVNTDFWRNRLSQSLTGLEPITIPGIGGGTQPPTAPTTPVQPTTPVIPHLPPAYDLPPPGTGPNIPDIPSWPQGETAVPNTSPDFWRTWNAQQAINQAGLRPDSRLPREISDRSGGFEFLGDLVDAAQRGLSRAVPNDGRDWLRLLADVGIFPGVGGLLVPRFNVPIPGATDDNPAGIERGVPGMDQMLRDNVREYYREYFEAVMPGAEVSDAQLISDARARLQAHYNGQEQMSSADVNRLRELVGMVNAFESGNAAQFAQSPVRPNIVGGTGGYMAPSAAAMLRGFTTATTRGGSQTAEERMQEFQAMLSRRSQAQER